MSRSLRSLAPFPDVAGPVGSQGPGRPETSGRASGSPDVVVWQADGQPLPGVGYAERITARLRPTGWSVEVVDHRTEALTDAQRAAPVHILSGGETSAFAGDDATERALGELTGLAQRAWSDDLTLIGICLGAQLLARVIAPELPRSTPAGGMEAGWRPIEGPEGTSWAAELHYEQIDPSLASIDGITVTHGNDHTPVQAFRWGSVAIGMQFHPEWTTADLRTVLDRHQAVLEAHHHDPAAAHRSLDGAADHDGDLFDRLVLAPIADRLGTTSAATEVAV